MRTLITLISLAALAAAVVVPAAAETPMDEDAAMAAMMEAATPGEFHAFLAKKAGRWTIEGRMWMEPGAEPVGTTSIATAEMILGGRYLEEEMSGAMMGMPFEGLGITGYNNATGEVTSVWYDTMGTGTMVLTGTWESPGAPLETTGTYFDPVTRTEQKVRTVSTHVDDDHARFEYFTTLPGGTEHKVMELMYSRAR